RNMELRAILTLSYGFEPVDPLPTRDLPQEDRLLVMELRRNHQGDGFADHFVGRISENPLGTFVPALDNAVQVFANDGVVRRFNNCGQTLRDMNFVGTRSW